MMCIRRRGTSVDIGGHYHSVGLTYQRTSAGWGLTHNRPTLGWFVALGRLFVSFYGF